MIRQSYRKFLIQSGILTAILLLCWLACFFFMNGSWLSAAVPVLIVFFYVVTAGLYYILLQSSRNRFSRFVNSFMIVTFGKILLYVVAIMVYVLLNKADAFAFVGAFFILYLAFTIFEIMAFLRDTKKMDKGSTSAG